MFRKLINLMRYLVFLLHSRTRFSVHSPFVYSLTENVFRGSIPRQQSNIFNQARSRLFSSRRIIEMTDFIPGNHEGNYVTKFGEVGHFARRSSVSRRDGELLYKMVKFFKPRLILELGTGFGISTLYLGSADPDTEIHTIEGCAAKAQIAGSLLAEHSVNARQYIGRFSTILDTLPFNGLKPGLVFIDGDHSYTGTLNLIERIRHLLSPETVVVIHDIYHSAEMIRAWREIISDRKITVSIDLFTLGIVFYRPGITKQHYRLRF